MREVPFGAVQRSHCARHHPQRTNVFFNKLLVDLRDSLSQGSVYCWILRLDVPGVKCILFVYIRTGGYFEMYNSFPRAENSGRCMESIHEEAQRQLQIALEETRAYQAALDELAEYAAVLAVACEDSGISRRSVL